MAWEYHIAQVKVIERWSAKRQEREVEAFQGQLNELGRQDWEMIGFESVPLVGGITGGQKGYVYLTFFKRRT